MAPFPGYHHHRLKVSTVKTKQFPQSDEHKRHAQCDLATLSIT